MSIVSVDQQICTRLGTARLMLENVAQGSDQHVMLSSIQTNAIVEMLRKDLPHVTAEARANIAEQVMSAKFCQDHRNKILSALQGTVLDNSRRKSQDGMSVLHFLSEAEWEYLQQRTATEVCDKLVDVLMFRLDVVNPNEATKKYVASAALTITYEHIDSIGLQEKNSLKTYVTNRVNARKKRQKMEVADYMYQLPATPAELQAQHPTIYEKAIKEVGAFAECKLEQFKLLQVNNSYQCRNTMAASSITSTAMVAATPAAPNADLMMQCMLQCFTKMMSQRSSDDIDLVFPGTGPRGARRSLAAMADASVASGPPQLKRAKTFEESRAKSVYDLHDI